MIKLVSSLKLVRKYARRAKHRAPANGFSTMELNLATALTAFCNTARTVTQHRMVTA